MLTARSTLSRLFVLSVFASVVVLSACTTGNDASQSGYVIVEADKSNSEQIAKFYLSGLAESQGDVALSNFVVVENGDITIRPDSISVHYPLIGDALRDITNQGRIQWDSFEEIMSQSYYAARQLPPTIDSLIRKFDVDRDNSFVIDVDGVMTTARRHTFIGTENLRAALRAFEQNSDKLVYPVGTVVIGEHIDGDTLVETTAMIKRPDDFWDFAVYDSMGMLADSTQPLSESLAAPAQCTGCHFGKRANEPEKSFPGNAPVGPDGPRKIHMIDPLPSTQLVRFFDEHRRRSDYLLGLYGTLYVNRLMQTSPSDSLIAPFMTRLDQN
ncbi:MAG: hypothetical protein HKN43_07930 [Rhodothermales bacterium]|nr:hypothetical protein [Rhodothermales bacterium]